ncbi:MAG: hypothetical protein LAP39_16430 [Acidobacteriia bacterium]|nr:hypothetical protein [Terriglobia bacterium]
MPETLEMLRYIEHLRRRWRAIAVACGAAVGLALLVALLTTPRYTATALIIIEPPAGSDSRVAVAVSPIYLESLKSYELLASGDRLFLDAVEHFKLPRSQSVDALKDSVLKVRIPRNTKVLEISATLHNPVQAQALALYIADQTVRLARDITRDTERELIDDTQRQIGEARARVEQAERAWVHASEEPMSGVTDRAVQVGTAQAERDAARAAFDAAERRLEETRSTAGQRGEQLKVMDPGVVPERPSWPNTPLMLLAAFLVALVASLLYLTLELSFGLERSTAPRSLAPLARVKTGND